MIRIALFVSTALVLPLPALGQMELTEGEAVDMALARDPALVVARADSAVARALVSRARAVPNPILSAGYSEDPPQLHFAVEEPIVLPWLRSAQVRQMQEGATAATLRAALARAQLARDVKVLYALGAAAVRRRALSERTAQDGLELVRIAERRRDAGDASDLEVSLARVAAGDVVNQAAMDSLDAVSALLSLQALVGEPPDRVTIVLADSLALPGTGGKPDSMTAEGPRLAVAAARADVRAGEAGLSFALRNRFPEPSLTAGFDAHDPTGSETGALPVLGVALSLPLFNLNRGEIGQARADLERARGALELTRRESDMAAAAADRQRVAARGRAERDRALLADAEQVATLSRRAYEEGEYPLSSVLEAQRAARDARLRYIDDLAAARVAEAEYELVTTTGRQP